MIIDALTDAAAQTPEHEAADRYRGMVYGLPPALLQHVMTLVEPGPVAFLFSGSWRLNIDATYVELKSYRHCGLPWHPNTIFVEPERPDLYQYALRHLQASTLVMLHSDYWTGHRPVWEIFEHMQQLCPPSRVICSLPLAHANFNKLTHSVSDLCDQMPALSVFDDSLILIT